MNIIYRIYRKTNIESLYMGFINMEFIQNLGDLLTPGLWENLGLLFGVW